MEEEYFYDSLEEDYSIPENDKFESKEIFKSYDITTTLPLYSGETSRTSLLNSSKVSKRKSRPNKPIIINKSNVTNSYLSMFYKKINYLQHNEDYKGTETSRAICEDLTPKSSISDVESFITSNNDYFSDDDESFYKKFIESDIKNNNKINDLNHRNKISINTSTLSTISSLSSQISSNSKQCSNKTVKRDLSAIKSSTDNQHCYNEKLNLLRKRQSYGQKVNKRNKINLEEINNLKTCEKFKFE